MATEPGVKFTSDSADRIAKVVRLVEAGNRAGSPLDLPPRLQQLPAKGVRFCSWTATWTYAQTATITFDPATNVTATATNVILGVAPGQGWVAKKGTASWCLIGFDMTKQPGYSSGSIQLFGHSTESACAQWYSITECSTATT